MSFAINSEIVATDVLFDRRYGILQTVRVDFKSMNAIALEHADGTAVQPFTLAQDLSVDLLIGDIEISQKAEDAKHPVLISATSILYPGRREVGATDYKTAARAFLLSFARPSEMPEDENIKVHYVVEQADGSISSHEAPELFNELRVPDIHGQGKVELVVGARESSGAASIVAKVSTNEGIAFFRSDSTDLRSAFQALAPFIEENAERELRPIKNIQEYLYTEY